MTNFKIGGKSGVVDAIVYGGLAFSAMLTFSLAIRLFGMGVYGVIMGASMLALFEGGAAGWKSGSVKARGSQRGIAKFALWATVGFSVASSMSEIVLTTGYAFLPQGSGIIVNFLTLAVLSLALAVNIICGIKYYLADPDIAAVNQVSELEAMKMQAAHDAKQRKEINKVTRAAQLELESEEMVDDMIAARAHEYARIKADSYFRDQVAAFMGHNHAQLPAPSQYVMPSSLMPHSTDVGGGGEKPATTTTFGKDVEAPKAPPPPNSQ